MQDTRAYNYNLTLSDIISAQEQGQAVSVIINGEYYDLQKSIYIDNPSFCFRDNGVTFEELKSILKA